MLNNLFPKTAKLKKSFYPKKLRIKKMSDNLLFGTYGIKLKNDSVLYLKNLESLKKNANKILKKIGKFWIRPFPNFFITKKPLEVRMGNGKGNFFTWCVNLPKGFMLLEFSLLNYKNNINILKIFKILSSKIRGSVKFVKKNDLY